MADAAPNPFAEFAPPAQGENPFAEFAPHHFDAQALGLPRAEGSFAGAFLHGGTFGLSDEIEAGLASPLMYGVDKLTGRAPKGATLGDYYDANLENIRQGQEHYAHEHPVLNAAGDLVGGMADFNPTSALKSVAKGFWPMARQGAAVGGSMGAASGFGDAEGGWDQRAMGAAKGAAVGGILGGSAPALVPWVIGAGGKLSQMISRAMAPWSKISMNDFIDEMAGSVLHHTAGPTGAHFDQPPLPGMKPTTGQATDNPGLQALERTIEGQSPEGADMTTVARHANRDAITGAIGQLGDTKSDASTAMSDAVEKAFNRAQAHTRAAWKAAGVDQTTGISAPQLQQHVDDYLKGLTVASRKNIDPDILDTLGQLSKSGTTSLGEIQDLRSNVTDGLRAAVRSGQTNKARILGGLADTISDFIDAVPMPKDASDAYLTARDATRQMKQTFQTPKAIRNALGVDAYGDDKTPVSAVADTFIRSGKGAPEAFDAYLDAVDSQLRSAARPGQTAADRIAAVNDAKQAQEEAYQAARDAFTQRFLDQVQSRTRDVNGAPVVSSKAVQGFLDDHAHIVDSRIFSDDQRDLMQRIAGAADMAQRASGPGTRLTKGAYADLNHPTRFVDVLIGPGASKLLPLAGAAVGAHTGFAGGEIGAGLGAAAGLVTSIAGESKLMNLMYGATRDRVLDTIHEAMGDPALAKALMDKATPMAAVKMPSAVRAKLYGLLGYQLGETGKDTAKALTYRGQTESTM